MDGGDGNDSLFAHGGGDFVYGGAGDDSLDADGGDDFLYGGDGSDFLDAADGHNLLDGGSGDDTLIAGDGNDTYVFGPGYGADFVSDAGGTDRVVVNGLTPAEVSFERSGNDVVMTVRGTGDRLTLSNWFALGSRIESIEFSASETMLDAATIEAMVSNAAPVAAADSATVSEDATSPVTGSVLANDSDPNADALGVANPGTYEGRYGTLVLEADGSYSYTLNSSLPEVQALAQGQTLTDSFGYTVTDGVVLNPLQAISQLNIVIEGANEAPVCQGRTIIGTKRDDHLVGTDCDDVIDGRRGSDTMVGGKGDDTYYVDAGHHHRRHHDHHHGHHHHRGDQVVERPNEGHDTVYSSASYVLPVNVEDLHLLGDKNLDGAGNAAANWIEGNRGNNDLRGGAGDDLLQGGEGKDRLRGGKGIDIL
ncbi:MAG: VCBS domain-containing protein, partial [Candidatus Binatia bacterium]